VIILINNSPVFRKHLTGLTSTIPQFSYKLLWVDQGFSDMTGYHSHDVIGKKPNMLHGQNTKDSERKLFRNLLASNEVFTTRITNHKKSGQAYICEVKIVPLFDQNNELSHYIALEREIAA
jgi:PAS domain S-box-containing protein